MDVDRMTQVIVASFLKVASVTDKQHNNVFFTKQSFDQIKSLIKPNVLAHFEAQWERIINAPTLSFHAYPFSQDQIDAMKEAHFWHELVTEILEYGVLSAEKVAHTVGTTLEFIRDLQWDRKPLREITLSIGTELLILHAKVRTDLQIPGGMPCL
jgi:hypothetical protein